jgi:hypothetical protein
MSVTWNPSDKSSFLTLSNGDKTATIATDGNHSVRATESKTGTGKWYFEILNTTPSTWNCAIGVGGSDLNLDGTQVGETATSTGWKAFSFYHVNNSFVGGAPSYGAGDVLMVACDIPNNKVYFGKNGTWNGSQDPAAGTGGLTGCGTSNNWFPIGTLTAPDSGSYSHTLRALATDQSYSAPSGYTAWEAASNVNDLTAATLTNTAPVLGPATFYENTELQLFNSVLDFGLNAFTLANKIVVCSTRPSTYTEANSTYKVGEKDFGIGNVLSAGPIDASPSGRKVTTEAVSDGVVTSNGTPDSWAVVDDANSLLLAAGEMTGSEAVTTSDTFSLEAFTINIPAELN